MFSHCDLFAQNHLQAFQPLFQRDWDTASDCSDINYVTGSFQESPMFWKPDTENGSTSAAAQAAQKLQNIESLLHKTNFIL